MSASATRQILVITAGLSQPSSTRLLGDRLAAATRQHLIAADEQPEIEMVELREYAHELTNHLLTGFASGQLASLINRVASADALIVVSPIFSGSYSGLFKMFFDVLDRDTVTGKPVIIAATGGTARHSLALEYALRPLFSYLRMVIMLTAVFAATEDFAATGDWGSEGSLADRVDRAAVELTTVLTGTAATRTVPASNDDDAEVVDFATLLAHHTRPAERRNR